MILFLIFLGVVVGGIIWYYNGRRSDAAMIMTWVSIVLLFITGIVWLCIYTGSLEDYGDLMACRKYSLAEYDRAVIDITGLLPTTNDGGGLLALPYHNLAIQITDAIEARKVSRTWYYKKIEQYSIQHDRWFTRQFLAKPPEGFWNWHIEEYQESQ